MLMRPATGVLGGPPACGHMESAVKYRGGGRHRGNRDVTLYLRSAVSCRNIGLFRPTTTVKFVLAHQQRRRLQGLQIKAGRRSGKSFFPGENLTEVVHERGIKKHFFFNDSTALSRTLTLTHTASSLHALCKQQELAQTNQSRDF